MHPCIVYACGSGGTGAGLVLGGKLPGSRRAGSASRASTCATTARTSSRRCLGSARTPRRAGSSALGLVDGDFDLVDGHVGLGYAKSRPEELATIREVCGSDGVVLDPVYTGKAFHGVVTELRRDANRFGGLPIAFVHTGGMFGLFGGKLDL